MSLRVLVVEDEGLIALMIQDMLESMGHEVTAKAANLEDAIRLTHAGGFDAVLLDVNLGGEVSYALARQLRANNVPFIFTTGYGKGIEEEWRNCRILPKPFAEEQLKVALDQLAT